MEKTGLILEKEREKENIALYFVFFKHRERSFIFKEIRKIFSLLKREIEKIFLFREVDNIFLSI